jgi:hypothetical protein
MAAIEKILRSRLCRSGVHGDMDPFMASRMSRMGMMPGEYSSGMGGATSGMMPPPSHNPHHSGHYSTNNGDLHRNVPSSNTAASSYSKRIVPAGGTATARRSSNISKGPFTTLQDPIYPTLLSSIYNAIMNLLQRHLHSCHMVPSHVMETTHHHLSDGIDYSRNFSFTQQSNFI